MTLELGGSDPMIICDDADLAAAASAASMGRFYNCGQACLAIKRVYVFESVADEVIEAIAAKAKRLRVGRGDAERLARWARCTPRRQRDEVGGQIDATRQGGTLAAGGRRRTTPSWPTACSTCRPSCVDPPHDSPMAHRGGLRPRAPDLARARTSTRRSSAPTTSPFGLGSSVWTRDLDRARAQAAERIEAGYTWVNSRTKVYDELPFGGWKSSGYGKEHG